MTIHWAGREWLTQEAWGDVHPSKTLVFYDESMVSVRPNGLHLGTHRSPRISPAGIRSQIGIGLVSCTTQFQYGTFEIEAMLPKGRRAWPAFWLWGQDAKLGYAEIDIFEGYRSPILGYFTPFAWKVQATLHPDGKSVRGLRGWRSPAGRFVRYSLVWEAERIVISYDGKLIEEILGDYCTPYRQPMYLILNNSMTADPGGDAVSDFWIRSLVVRP